MACITKSKRLQAIFDVVDAIVRRKGNDINTLENVVDYFKEHFPEIEPVEIYQAVTPVDSVQSEDIIKTLGNTKSRLQKLDGAVNRLNVLMTDVTKNKTKVPPLPEVEELNKVLKDIRDLTGLDLKVPPEAYGEIASRIENLLILHDAYYSLNDSEVSAEHVKRAVDHAREIKRLSRVKEVNEKIAELDKQISDLKLGDFTFDTLENLDAPIKLKGLDREIARKDLELQQKRAEFELELQKQRRKRRAEKGVFGFKGKPVEIGFFMLDAAYEPFRAIKFMGDISAWGVQAAPLVYSMLTDVNFKAALNGNLGQAFASQKKLGQIFKETVYDVIFNSAREASFRKSPGTEARKQLNELKARPYYPLALKAGLQISEARSLTNSEEIFTSNLLNKIPGLGAIKDISEDTMVSTLNALRMAQFEKYYEMLNGDMSIEGAEQAARLINNMTGTTSNPTLTRVSGGLKYMMSAPKLALGRIELLLRIPKTFATVDVPTTFKKGMLSFQTEADRFVFNETMGMLRGYVAFAVLAAMINGLEFEDDPRESDFLRFRWRNLGIDATGGIGSIARTFLKAYHLAFGAPEGASYSQKERINYLRNVQKEDELDALLTGLLKYKLHPTITGARSLVKGTDFFGTPFHDFFGAEGAAPYAEGLIRAFMPISFETIADGVYSVIDDEATIAEATLEQILQTVGYNTFIYDNKLQDIRLIDYFNQVEKRPRVSYPDRLSKSEEGRTKRYLQDQYKQMWGDKLGEAILSRGATKETVPIPTLDALRKQARSEADVEFMSKYGEEVRKLKLKK